MSLVSLSKWIILNAVNALKVFIKKTNEPDPLELKTHVLHSKNNMKVRALSWWSRSEEANETKLELKQPFSSTLSQTSFHTLSHSSLREQRSSHQVRRHACASSISTRRTCIISAVRLTQQFFDNSAHLRFEAVFFTSI